MERQECLLQRNTKVRQLYAELEHKHPQWRYSAVVEHIAQAMYLSPRTIQAILNNEGVYSK